MCFLFLFLCFLLFNCVWEYGVWVCVWEASVTCFLVVRYHSGPPCHWFWFISTYDTCANMWNDIFLLCFLIFNPVCQYGVVRDMRQWLGMLVNIRAGRHSCHWFGFTSKIWFRITGSWSLQQYYCPVQLWRRSYQQDMWRETDEKGLWELRRSWERCAIVYPQFDALWEVKGGDMLGFSLFILFQGSFLAVAVEIGIVG